MKSEKPLVEKTLRLSEMLSEMGGTPILIGGVGMRFSASSAFRAAFNDAKSDERSTDVDFALPLIPEGLSPLLKRREIEVLSAEFNGKEIEFVASRILGSSFHIEEKYETAYPLFSEACFFSGEICNFRLNAEDFSLATAHYVESGGRTYQIAVADTALLVATNLKPHAASKKRMKRAAFAVMAHNDRLEHMAKRVAELFGRMELDRFELEKTLRAFYLVFHGYSAEIADGFMRELGRHLPAAKRVSRLV